MSALSLVVTSVGQRRPPVMTDLSDDENQIHGRIPEMVRYVDHPSFADAGAESRFFGCLTQSIRVPRWRYFHHVPDARWRAPEQRVGLSSDEQTRLFLRYNYAKYRLSILLGQCPGRCSTQRAKEMVQWYRHVLVGRSDLVEANMALVVAMAKRTRIPNVDFEELISEGSLALLRSIETFDLTRGHKLSTYACRSILKSFNRLATKTGRYRQRFPTEYDPALERSDYDERKHEMQRAERIESLRDILIRNRAKLTEMELVVVMERFAIGFAGKGRTLREVGQLIGVTAERVRQLQELALVKLRRALTRKHSTA